MTDVKVKLSHEMRFCGWLLAPCTAGCSLHGRVAGSPRRVRREVP